jgi:CHAD domain-containing protein
MAKAKVITGIDCDTAAAEGIAPVLTSRLGEMCELRESALDWSDPKGVHDMRVASRRLRSALSDFMPYLRKRGLASTLKEIKTIADALGEVRDQDVAIAALETLATEIPATVAETLKLIVDERKTVLDKARKELSRVVRKGRLKQLESDFAAAISAATTEAQSGKPSAKARMTYRRVTRSIMLERLGEVQKLSDALYHPLDVDALHELRIAAKRLRYALELFQPCWGETISTIAKKVAGLQTSLGELHDCDVWIESFGDRLIGAKKNGEGPSEASLWLLSHFLKIRTKHLRDALSLWCEWEAEETSRNLIASLEI